MKVIVALLALAVGYLAWVHRTQSALLNEHEKQIGELIAAHQSQRISTSLDAQERCARQAAIAFKELGWARNPAAVFGNHFSARDEKCFMKIESATVVGSTPWTNKTVLDAFEGRVIGTYAWKSDPGKKYWEVPPVTCQVTLRSGEKRTCASDEEFEDLVKTYME
jgi:hypothetical protein